MEKSKYLQNKLESKTLSKDELSELYSRLNKPIADFEILDQGDITIEKDDLMIKLSYSPVPADLHFEKVKEVLDFPKDKQRLVELMRLSSKEFRSLDSFILQNKDLQLDITSLLPEGVRVFFRSLPNESKREKDPKPSGLFDPTINVVVVRNNLATPLDIIVLMHEIGHANDEVTPKILDFPRPKGPDDKVFLTQEQMEIRLKSERNAWAFAIKKIKPFLSDLGITTEDLDMFAHNFALHIYSEEINKMLSGKPYIEV